MLNPSLSLYLSSALRVSTAWTEHMRTLTPISDAKFISAARPLVPLIEAAALKLVAVVNMNRTVHTPTYNVLIADAVKKASSSSTR